MIDLNHQFESDNAKQWLSGIVNCTNKKVIYSLEGKGPKELSFLLYIIDQDNKQKHKGGEYEVHILACRIFTDKRYWEKYLKYKQKYLALKNQHI